MKVWKFHGLTLLLLLLEIVSAILFELGLCSYSSPSQKKEEILKTRKAGDICKTHKVTRVTGPLPTKCKRLLGRGESRGVA